MSVQLTPKGTRGLNMPKLPPAVWKFFTLLTNLRMKLVGGKTLELTTVGNKTGQERSVTLRYFPDGTNWIIVASFGGSTKHPAWYVNLAKNPTKVWVTVNGQKIPVRAESLHGAEREEWWKQIIAAAPGYAGYQVKTDREIPVIRLTRT